MSWNPGSEQFLSDQSPHSGVPGSQWRGGGGAASPAGQFLPISHRV